MMSPCTINCYLDSIIQQYNFPCAASLLTPFLIFRARCQTTNNVCLFIHIMAHITVRLMMRKGIFLLFLLHPVTSIWLLLLSHTPNKNNGKVFAQIHCSCTQCKQAHECRCDLLILNRLNMAPLVRAVIFEIDPSLRGHPSSSGTCTMFISSSPSLMSGGWGLGEEQKPKHGTPFISGCPRLIRGINTLFPLSVWAAGCLATQLTVMREKYCCNKSKTIHL